MLLKRLIALLIIFTISGFASGQAFTGDGWKNNVVNSSHDLSTDFSTTQVCEFCHTPHKFTATANPPLLWNVTVATGPYTTYSSSSFNGAADIRDPAAGTGDASYMTLLCLSCHDGTVTEASFYELPTGAGTATLNPPDVGFGGLANDHPVDFTYSVALATADGALQSPTEGATVAIPYVGVTNDLPLYKDLPGDTSGRMECATCHNPHDDTNGRFLRMGNTASALCLNCHGN